MTCAVDAMGPPKWRSLAQADKTLIRFDFDEQRRLCRHRVIGVVYRLGQIDFDGNSADVGDAHALKFLFLNFLFENVYPAPRLLKI